MNQLTNEEINNIMFKYGLEMDDEHHAAMIREAIEAEHKRLLGVGMEPVLWSITYNGHHVGNGRQTEQAAVREKSRLDAEYPNDVRVVAPLYTAEAIAVARLQDQQRIAELEAQLAERNADAEDSAEDFQTWYENAIWGNEDFKAGCQRAWDAARREREAQLAESGYSACDMATAAAQGFRDGMSQSK